MGVDRVCTPVSASADPQRQDLLLLGGEGFFRRHFTLQDSLQKQAAGWLIGVERAAGITAFAKAGEGCEVQAAFGVVSAMAAEAVGSQQWCDLRIKVDCGGGSGILCRGGREQLAERQCEQQYEQQEPAKGGRTARDCRVGHGRLSRQNRGGWSVC